MSYTYLLEQGEESSAASFADIPQFALSRLNLTHEKSCCRDNEMESCPSSQFGMMCEPLMENRGEERLMSSAEGSHAKTSALLETERDSMEIGVDCGEKWPELLAKFDQDSFLWRTAQLLLFEDWGESLEIWPLWGMTRGGAAWALTCLEPNITAPDSGWLPTPTCADAKNAGGRQNQYDLSRHAREVTGQRLSVHFSEWMMDWPIGWTDTTPLETAKFQQWLVSHGKSSVSSATIATTHKLTH
jgi:hypothetical protein